jgi:uncharacterized OB-fold protein
MRAKMSGQMDEAAEGPRFVDPELVSLEGGRLQLKGGRCKSCGALSFPKGQVCTQCLSLEIDDKILSGEGELYSYSRVHMAPKGWDVPYTIGYVDLPEGIRIFAHIDESAGRAQIGARVRLGQGRVGTAQDGAILKSYLFAPVAGGRA